MQIVKAESPVDDSRPYLKQWDSTVRKYYLEWESRKVAALQNLQALSSNPLTRWRSVPQLHDRYTAVDTIQLQQMLGKVSADELNELNRVMGGITCSFNRSGMDLYAINLLTAGAFLGAGLGFTALGLMSKSNLLWAPAGFLPVMVNYAIQRGTQDQTQLQNAYRYLIAKRAALAEFESSKHLVQNNASVQKFLQEN